MYPAILMPIMPTPGFPGLETVNQSPLRIRQVKTRKR